MILQIVTTALSNNKVKIHIQIEMDLMHALDRRTSFPNTEVGDSVGKPRQKRLNSMPNFQIGIPLGSQTAQLASKSFWNPQMLQTSMEKIAQCAARESSSLGSSLESIDSIEDEEFDENVVQVSDDSSDDGSTSFKTLNLKQFKFTVVIEENIRNRVLRHPHEKMRYTSSSTRSGENTPPYVSPGLTKRLSTNRQL